MANKEIGSLFVTMNADVNGLDKNLQKVTTKLNKLANAFDTFSRSNLNGVTQKFNTMSRALQRFTQSFSPSTVGQLMALTDSMNKMANTLTKFSDLDFGKLESGFTNLTMVVEPFLNKLKESEQVLNSFANATELSRVVGQLEKVGAEIENINARTKKVNMQTDLTKEKILTEIARREKVVASMNKAKNAVKSVSKEQDVLNNKTKFWNMLWRIGKLAFAFRVVKRMASKIAEIVELASSYNEALNKFQHAMTTQYSVAIKYANQMAEKFGLAKETILDYQSTFMNMINAIGGLDISTSEKLSEVLTTMAIDYSSLFNTSLESAMNAFQSMLSGRAMAIRSASGIDVTDNTIYEYYKKLGGEKTLNSLSVLEKRLLRILAVYKQMETSDAIGDYALTINEFANQQRVFQEQLEELKTWLGNMFIPLLKNIMPYVNGLVMATKEILKSFAYIFGYKEEIISGILDLSDNTGEFNGTLDETNEELTQLMGLLSFDKFNVLKVGVSKDDSDINKIVAELMNISGNVSASMEKISMRAIEIRDSVMEWLGYEKQVNEETGELSFVLKEGFTNLQLIKYTLEGIVALGILKGAKLLVGVLSSIFTSLMSTQSVLLSISKIGIVVGLSLLVNGIIEGNKALTITGSTLLVVFSTLKLIQNLNLVKSLFNSKLAMTIYTLTMKLGALKSTLLSIGIAGGLAFVAFKIFDSMDEWSAKTKVIVGVLGTLASALMVATAGWLAFHGAMTFGTAIPIILGSIAVGVASVTSLVKGVSQFASGGFPEQGQLFIANENGAELVGSMNGSTAVANNQEITDGIRQASYEGMSRALREQGGSNATITIDGSKVNDNAFVRAILPALRVEQKRVGGR